MFRSGEGNDVECFECRPRPIAGLLGEVREEKRGLEGGEEE